eukprot:g131.t1
MKILLLSFILSCSANVLRTRKVFNTPISRSGFDIPSTFTFINETYTGNRFDDKVVLVAGGTSGIGFASAAMFAQECAKSVYIVGQNRAKGEFAARAINEKVVRSHCNTEGLRNNTRPVHFLRADLRNRKELRTEVFGKLKEEEDGRLDVLVNSAGISGWVLIGLPDIPDDVFLGEQDAIYNNLYGSLFLMSEAMRFWGFTNCVSAIGQRACPKLGYTPSIVNLASEQGLTSDPAMLMYGASKAGIISATQSVSRSYSGSLRANVVAPGLISTPLTWNQVRSYTVENGKLNHTFPSLQTSFQCSLDGQIVISGDCIGGGKGSPGCACPDVQLDDERVELMFKSAGLWPLVDPRKVAEAVLFLSSDEASDVNGETYVVDKGDSWSCPALDGPPLKPNTCCTPGTSTSTAFHSNF